MPPFPSGTGSRITALRRRRSTDCAAGLSSSGVKPARRETRKICSIVRRNVRSGGLVRGLRTETCAQIHDPKIRTRMRRCEHGAPCGNELTVSRYADRVRPAISCQVERRVPSKIARRGRCSPTCWRERVLKWRIGDPANPTPEQEARREQHIFWRRLCSADIVRRAQTLWWRSRKATEESPAAFRGSSPGRKEKMRHAL